MGWAMCVKRGGVKCTVLVTLEACVAVKVVHCCVELGSTQCGTPARTRESRAANTWEVTLEWGGVVDRVGGVRRRVVAPGVEAEQR